MNNLGSISDYYQVGTYVDPTRVYPTNSCNDVYGVHTHTDACSQLNPGTVVSQYPGIGAAPVTVIQPVQQIDRNPILAHVDTAPAWDILSESQEVAYMNNMNATRIDGDILTEAAIDFYRHVQEESFSENISNDPTNPWMQTADELFSFLGNISNTRTNWIYKVINYAKDHPFLSLLAITLALATTICIFGHIGQKTVNKSDCNYTKSCVVHNTTNNNLYLFYFGRN
jgi:hypothetical protein